MPFFVLKALTNIVKDKKKTKQSLNLKSFSMLISGTPDSRFQSDLEHVKKACRHVWVILLPTVTCLKELALHGKGI